ncbi:MAG: endolytic transglycosylase MltG [Sulfurovum sp.]|nr:endolytic transglycosylase MltG [Sulfurovum sp.]MCB4750393.1 endolytic transglycosylase MltG [Sulfurovum sp.]MCB4761189.1 endolytic transglycosylase MltG [Sulfurovum sp.]MCB4772694.1 endolytic transglycosylase MltG [Sulfurovum sp.]
MKKSRIAIWMLRAESIAVVLIISLAYYISLPVKSTQTVYIPQGTIDGIISYLTKSGYELSKIDSYLVRLMGQPQQGWIFIGDNRLNRIDFLHKLTSSKAMIHKVILIPGETLDIFFENLAKKFKLDKNKLKQYYQEYSHYPEAGIYADTYYVPINMKEEHLIHFLVRESEKYYQNLSQKIYGNYDIKQWQEILIIASIIQKEAANDKEMALVSSVIYNRLKKGMRLQMDGTLNYGKYSHVKVTSKRIKDDNSTFNTYKFKGLPPSPIGSVSLAAIKAAINPVKTDYLYFMKNKENRHNFSKTFRSHRKNIQRVKSLVYKKKLYNIKHEH